ncbi:Zinc finger, CCCH-type [Cinnamomum micranthum f. kanehirae]|uniref:Zinc finger, CCCH-type n=1 Tax=Cinnamomum micranthum f. kanehirae TaxID=337451 RepID=A0A3S3PZ35_9MAGN|nr:Zinc finger, CCCH-type [Cinnamomum micranthum f. kanehirae]
MASAASSPQTFPYPSTLNVGNFVSLKLTKTNFLLWKTQIMGLIESQDMVGFINGEYPAPPKTLPAAAILQTASAANATFAAWRRSDSLLRGWITGTLSEEVLGLVVGLETSADVWQTLEGSFAKESQEREFYLVQQLQMHRKGTSSLDDYIRTFKGYCDDLSAIGKPIADRQKVFSLLRGLGPAYEPFVTSMLKPPTPSYKEIIPLLQGHETMRTMHISDGFVPPNPNVAFFGQKQNGGKRFNQKGKHSGHFTSTRRGFSPAGQPANQDLGVLGAGPQARNTDKQYPNDRPDKGTICQICNKPNHSAMRCWHRFNQTYQPGDAVQALAAFNLADHHDPSWFPDTGATAHMTPDVGKLHSLSPYQGSDKILVGNGTALDITHIGTASVKHGRHELKLNNVLVVPDIKKNLLSVSQITSEYPYLFEFSCDGFVVKHRITGQLITTGARMGGLYSLQPINNEAMFSTRFRAASDDVWHQRLGHPQTLVLDLLKKNNVIISTTKVNNVSVCDSCQMAKACRLPFLNSVNCSNDPVSVIHCDLWGPAPVLSCQHFRYYVIFVDECTRFTWYFPLKKKSDFYQCFVDFYKYVKTQFARKIRIFQSDGGGEFSDTRFGSFLLHKGIIHRKSCPHTPQQNGLAERKHRNVTELGLTLLFHGGVPLRFWVDAFFTAVWLINRQLSRVINWTSPYQQLTGKSPDYESLRVFGCKCFPYLRDYANNKFAPRSLPCVFLGYSTTFKGYRCYYPPTGRIYTSRHVVFDEHTFPFKDPGSLFSITNKNGAITTFSEWVSGASESTSSPSPAFISSLPAVTDAPSASSSAAPHRHSVAPSNVPFLNDGSMTQQQASAGCSPSTDSFQHTLHVPGGFTNASTRLSTHDAPSAHRDQPAIATSHSPHGAPLLPANAPPIEATYHHSSDKGDHDVPPIYHVATSSSFVNPSTLPVDTSNVAHSISSVAPPIPNHPMLTRAKSGMVKPNPRYSSSDYALTAELIPKEPKSIKSALQHQGWLSAMQEEITALNQNGTWILVPRTSNMNVVGCKWVYKTKLRADGSLERLKARLVAKGFNQVEGIDFSETFSPVVKPATIRIVLTIALAHNWDIRQLDVKNAFLNGHLHENVFMEQPPRFAHPVYPHHVCHLKKALYGLRQAPRAWFDRFSIFLLSIGFFCSTADSSLFICHGHLGPIFLLLYVDDIILTGNNPFFVTWVLDRLHQEFAMKDLGYIHYFLGIQVQRFPGGLFLNQTKYASELLEKALMHACKPIPTPMVQKLQPSTSANALFPDPQLYQSLVGGLLYLTFTRPDISYSVNYVCQFMHNPTTFHFQLVKRILRYVRGTITYGIHLLSNSSLKLYAFSDADWAGCPLTRRSTTGYCTYLGSNCISWSSKRQPTVARSSTEAEYRALASTAAEITWLTYILRDIGLYLFQPPILFCDNISALHMTVNPVFHARTKHIELDYHFVREKVALGSLVTRFVPSTSQVADILTKPLSRHQFEHLRVKLGVQPASPPSLKGCVEDKSQT